MVKHTVRFLPLDKSIEVDGQMSILEAATEAGIGIKSTCGGDGSCGRCTVLVKEGKTLSTGNGNLPKIAREQGLVLACKTNIASDIIVEIPKDSLIQKHQILLEEQGQLLSEASINVLEFYNRDSIVSRHFLTLSEPTLNENVSDLTRLNNELKKLGFENINISLANLRELAESLRGQNWQVTVTISEINGVKSLVSIEAGHIATPLYALAIDIGTTTVVVNLIDVTSGQIVCSEGSYNKQAAYGDDVITRIVHASDEKNGLSQLQQAIISTLNQLINKIVTDKNIKTDDLKAAVIASNTTMTQLFLGVNPKYIRLEPYIPTFSQVPVFKASELGLQLNPEASIYNFPAVSSYVGGDVVSGVLATNIPRSEEIILFIDIGTNGEMVLGNRDWLMTCACSAGPAFEGGGITYGTRAMSGAIERVEITKDTYEVFTKTIENAKPIGICGSGLIDCLAKMRKSGLIDRSGKFNQNVNTPRLRKTDDDWEFVLVWAEDSDLGKDIVITENDIKNIIRSKGAIYSGIRTMLKSMDLEEQAIHKIIIAGGFGNYLNIGDAIQIGLLPDLPIENYVFLGNSSVKGARISLLSKDALQEAEEVAKKMTYLELSVGNTFMDEFVSALFLPHTDLSQFPSVTE